MKSPSGFSQDFPVWCAQALLQKLKGFVSARYPSPMRANHLVKKVALGFALAKARAADFVGSNLIDIIPPYCLFGGMHNAFLWGEIALQKHLPVP